MIKTTCTILFSVALLAAGGCRPASREASSRSHMGTIQNALIDYYLEHEQQYPDSLEELRDQIPDFDQVMSNPLTGDDPGYAYVKPGEDDDMHETILLYQLRNGTRDETLEVGYADGMILLKTE